MPKASSFKEVLARREPVAAERPSPSGSPANAVIRQVGPLTEPVAFAQQLTRRGLSLRKAHDVLNRVAGGEEVAVMLPAVEDRDALAAALRRLGLAVDWRDPPAFVDVRHIRTKLGLTQAEFAARFGFDLDTLQNWEQGRNSPDRSTRILLRIIDRNPKVVEESLT